MSSPPARFSRSVGVRPGNAASSESSAMLTGGGNWLVSKYFVTYVRKVLRLLYAKEMGDGVTLDLSI